MKFWIGILLAIYLSNLNGNERRSSAPYLSGDSFRDLADYIFDETMNNIDTSRIAYGSTIFVKTDFLSTFFEKIHPKIQKSYVLITHNSDIAIPGNHACRLDEDKLLAWFGINVEHYSHPKLHPIPIGLANRYWPHGNVEVINELKHAPVVFKKYLIYMNFAQETNLSQRSQVYNQFIQEPYCYFSPIKNFRDYLVDVQKSYYVLSPRGNGLDCHRTWEALYMEAIPIVISSLLDSLFEGLPVLVIQDWDQITPFFLEEQLKKLKSHGKYLEKLWMPYWEKRIDVFKSSFTRSN